MTPRFVITGISIVKDLRGRNLRRVTFRAVEDDDAYRSDDPLGEGVTVPPANGEGFMDLAASVAKAMHIGDVMAMAVEPRK